jgi:hypothetical protein
MGYLMAFKDEKSQNKWNEAVWLSASLGTTALGDPNWKNKTFLNQG